MRLPWSLFVLTTILHFTTTTQAEEDRRKKEESQRAALKQRQLNEMRYAYINGIKIHNQWRKIMRLAKVEDLRKEIEVLSQNHEREVDRKDAIIQMLDRDLEDAEEQHQMALRSHLTIVDSLLALQYKRVRALEVGGCSKNPKP